MVGSPARVVPVVVHRPRMAFQSAPEALEKAITPKEKTKWIILGCARRRIPDPAPPLYFGAAN